MGSTRFPGKPLAPILGRPMIEHVYRRSALSDRLDRLVVATPDLEIAEAVRGFAGDAVMTSPTHERATDRVAEAAETTGGDIVIVIQGDEPLIHPDMIGAAVDPVIEDETVFCSNLTERIRTVEEHENPNTIKVVMDANCDALYFSRSPIPGIGPDGFAAAPLYRQVCIIPFRRENLDRFLELAPTPLERLESIDMLRVLEHGLKVRLVETPFRTLSVDEPGEIRAVEEAMAGDPVSARY